VRLEVARDGDAASLVHDGAVVASARPASLVVEAPPPVGLDEACAASTRFAWEHDHPFPTCFGCGPERAEGEGLRIFPGPVVGRGLVAAPWIPAPALAGPDGAVAPEFLWAAMDCPTVWAQPALDDYADRPAALGRMVGRTIGSVAIGERCVVIGWPLAAEGRRTTAGAAVFGRDGELRAEAEAVWIRLR
jgi:hypothetical protein